jgi:sugar lactone lactonase YvrE
MNRLFLCLGLLAPLWASAQPYQLRWAKIAGGGGSSAGGSYSLQDTIGQPDAASTAGFGPFSLTGGFWSLDAVPLPDSSELSNPPVIVIQPVSASVSSGGSAAFAVSAYGSAPLSYQWLQNGANISYLPIITIAGGSESGGQATNAAIYNPRGIALDAMTNLYIADTLNNLIQKVDVNGVITTVAGVGNGQLNGSAANYSGDGVPATNASIAQPFGVTVDGLGNLYIADTLNNRVRKVNPSGIITTVAGNGTSGLSGDGGAAGEAGVVQPRSVSVDASGQIYLTDYNDGLVRMINTNGIINTVAGGGTSASAAGLMATACKLIAPSQVVVDGAGNFYVSDWVAGTVWKVAGNGLISYVWSGFSGPAGFALGASGAIYVAETGNNKIAAGSSLGGVSIVAGAGPGAFGGDGGQAVLAYLNYPGGVALDPAGNIYIADTFNNRIRQVAANGVIQTVAGNGFNSYAGDAGPAAAAFLAAPKRLASDSSGNVFIADYNNNCVREIDADGVISTVVGDGMNGYTPASFGGQATNAELSGPYAVAVDTNKNLFLSDPAYNQILKVNSSGLVKTLAGPGTDNALSEPEGLACDAEGNVYIADRDNNYVRKIDANGLETIVAGGGASLADGIQATNAQLLAPQGLAFDARDNLYVSLDGPSLVREISSTGIITTVAGNGSAGYSGDGGAATNAALNQPSGLVLDPSGNLYIAESANNRVRKVNLSGAISTVAGAGTAGFFGDGGEATNAWLNNPVGLALDPSGNLYVADSANNRVREVLLAGSPTLFFTDATGANAGNYQVVVSNQWGSVTSSVATLTVTSSSPPIVFTSAASRGGGVLTLGGTASPGAQLVLKVANGLVPPIQWQPVATNTSGPDGKWQFNPAISTSSLGGYFRVSSQ